MKVKAIHQLRPLQHGQPWGVFFVEFEKKKLPVIVLRRILSHLVVKKRASANKANAAAWDSADLLFISAFGDEATDQREIAFAHFHQDDGALPTLRVLDWDGGDTPLKLEHVAATLMERLRWPDNPRDHAVLHSPGYRSRYAEFLKIDFPRLPLTGNLELFRALARLGGELTALHLLESPKLAQPITEFIGGRPPEVEKISWSASPERGVHAASPSASPKRPENSEISPESTLKRPEGRAHLGTVWVDKAQTTGFRGVREDVWNFHIGGYQVCEKWLKDRKGRTLTKDDLDHYQKIVVALSETIRLMGEIDEVIEQHGGWPGAFAGKGS